MKKLMILFTSLSLLIFTFIFFLTNQVVYAKEQPNFNGLPYDIGDSEDIILVDLNYINRRPRFTLTLDNTSFTNEYFDDFLEMLKAFMFDNQYSEITLYMDVSNYDGTIIINTIRTPPSPYFIGTYMQHLDAYDYIYIRMRYETDFVFYGQLKNDFYIIEGSSLGINFWETDYNGMGISKDFATAILYEGDLTSYTNGYNDARNYYAHYDFSTQEYLTADEYSQDAYNEGKYFGYQEGKQDYGYWNGSTYLDSLQAYNEGELQGKEYWAYKDSGSYYTGSQAYSMGALAGENIAYNEGYKKGSEESFTSGIQNWIVPAIVITLIGGGVLFMLQGRRKGE